MKNKPKNLSYQVLNLTRMLKQRQYKGICAKNKVVQEFWGGRAHGRGTDRWKWGAFTRMQKLSEPSCKEGWGLGK